MSINPDDDWLTEFPLPMLPDSWDLNPIFLRKVEELTWLWDKHGYEWKLGGELEFTLHSPEDAAELTKGIVDNRDMRHLHPEYGLLEESRLSAEAAADAPGMMAYALERIRQSFSANPYTDRLLKESKWTHEAALDHLAEIESNLSSDDPKIIDRARQNIFLAYIHTHNFDEGGVMDLVEARFGDYELGLGWYDMSGPEIRTRLLSSPTTLIESYHKFLHILSTQAPRFGLALDLTMSAPPQIHISLWRKSDNKNMMTMADEESIVFCEHALRGYYELLDNAPFLIQDKDYRQHAARMEFKAGMSRWDYIREETDNWEIRRPQFHGITHLARHLMMVMMGTAYGVMYDVERERFSKEQYSLELERRQHPVVRHRYGAHISGLACVLEHCSIDDDGYLHPHIESISNYLERLKEEVGYGNLKKIVINAGKDSDISFDLRHESTWATLFQKIKIDDDNQMDLDFLGEDSEIAEAFAAIEITGRRTVLKTAYDHLCTEAHSTKKILHQFAEDPACRIFFTPDEYAEVTQHYTKQSMDILRENAGHLVSVFEEVRDIPANQKHSDSVFAEWFINDMVIKPTEDIDINQSFLMQLLASISIMKKWDRESVLAWNSYIVTIRPHFKNAVEARIQQLSAEPENNGKIESLKFCLDRVSKKPFNLQDEIWSRVEPLFIMIADGRMVNRTGLDRNSIHSLRLASTISILRAFGFAYRDNTFSDKQIVEELDILFHAVPSRLERLERQLKLGEQSEMSRALFAMCKESFLSALTDARDWACITLGTGLHNQLPAPKRNGPEQSSGPV